MNPAAFALAPAGTIGNAPRTITELRSPRQYNVDAVVQKDIGLTGGWKRQVRLEVLNVLNRPNVRALQGANTVGSSNFGQTTLQSGFMRILQFSFRMSF